MEGLWPHWAWSRRPSGGVLWSLAPGCWQLMLWVRWLLGCSFHGLELSIRLGTSEFQGQDSGRELFGCWSPCVAGCGAMDVLVPLYWGQQLHVYQFVLYWLFWASDQTAFGPRGHEWTLGGQDPVIWLIDEYVYIYIPMKEHPWAQCIKQVQNHMVVGKNIAAIIMLIRLTERKACTISALIELSGLSLITTKICSSFSKLIKLPNQERFASLEANKHTQLGTAINYHITWPSMDSKTIIHYQCFSDTYSGLDSGVRLDMSSEVGTKMAESDKHKNVTR